MFKESCIPLCISVRIVKEKDPACIDDFCICLSFRNKRATALQSPCTFCLVLLKRRTHVAMYLNACTQKHTHNESYSSKIAYIYANDNSGFNIINRKLLITWETVMMSTHLNMKRFDPYHNILQGIHTKICRDDDTGYV